MNHDRPDHPRRDAAEDRRATSLWAGPGLPPSEKLPEASGARFHLIKAYEPERDGYHWLKGVALAVAGDRLVATFGHNACASGENNATEVTNARISDDCGRTWSPVHTVDAPEGELATSHGVLLARGDEVWAFNGAFYGTGRAGGRVHTRACVADAATIAAGSPVWTRRGVVAWDGFWPLQEPLLMDDGRYVVAGASVGGGEGGNTIPAVALVDADDLTAWEVVRIPCPTRIWGESTIILQGPDLLLVSRSNRERLSALVSRSHDYGRTWSDLEWRDLPMADSKPYAGTLSDGRHYLINTVCADVGTSGRNPLSILVGGPGRMEFDTAYRLIDARWPLPGAEGYTHWAYPYAVEHDGYLWVGFYMGTKDKHGSGAAGMVVVPTASLRSGAIQ